MTQPFTDRSALVTGAATGIGAATAIVQDTPANAGGTPDAIAVTAGIWQATARFVHGAGIDIDGRRAAVAVIARERWACVFSILSR